MVLTSDQIRVLSNLDGTNVRVKLRTVEDIRDFVAACSKFKSDINVRSEFNGRTVVDGKSFISVLRLNINGYLFAALVSDDQDEITEFTKIMERFE